MTIESIQETASVTLESDNQGSCLCINNKHAQVRISLFGAHVLSYINKSDGRERLWLSKEAIFDQHTPIRGGIPICWPWFGAANNKFPANSPSHGFLRTQVWNLNHAEELILNNQVQETNLVLVPNQLSAFGFEHKVRVRLLVKINDKLNLQLETTNLDDCALTVSQALHTYFLIPRISEVVIDGIAEGYSDKLSGQFVQESPQPYNIDREVDRIHRHMNGNAVFIRDKETNKPRAKVSQRGHDSLVVWNPWIEKTARMSDMSKDGYTTMLCIEAANIDGLEIKAKETHTLEQIIY